MQVKRSAHSPTFLSLHLHHSSFSNPSVTLPTSQLIFQPFCCFTYVTAHSPTLPSLYLRHSSLSNPSVVSPTSQLVLQPFFCFSYVTGSSLTLPGEPPMVLLTTRPPILAAGSSHFSRPWLFWAVAPQSSFSNLSVISHTS